MKMHGVNARLQAAHRAWQGKMARGTGGHSLAVEGPPLRTQQHREISCHGRVAKTLGAHHTDSWAKPEEDAGVGVQTLGLHRGQCRLSVCAASSISWPLLLQFPLTQTFCPHQLDSLSQGSLSQLFPFLRLRLEESEPQVWWFVSSRGRWSTRCFQGQGQARWWLTRVVPTVAQAWPNRQVWQDQHMGSFTLYKKNGNS